MLKVNNISIYLIFASLLLFATRDFSQAQNSAISFANLHKVVAIALALGLNTHFLLKHGLKKKLPVAIKSYFFFILIGILSSIFFSTWLGYSLWKIAEILAVFMTVLFLWEKSSSQFDFIENSYDLCIRFIKLLVLLTICGIFIYPNEAIRSPTNEFHDAFLPYQLFGTIAQINANSLGAISAIIFYITFVRITSKKEKRTPLMYFWLILSTIVLIFAQSRTSIGALGFSLIFYLFLFRGTNGLFKFGILGIFTALLLYNFETFLLYIGRGYSIEHLDKMSGRMVWWEAAWLSFQNADFLKQIIGLGYGTANRTLLTSIGYDDASSLHSDYMDSLISTGFLGATFLSFSVLFSLKKILSKSRSILKSPMLIEAVGVFLIIFIRSFTGTSIATLSIFLLLFFICIFIIYNYRENEVYLPSTPL